MNNVELIELKKPTNRTVSGPKVVFEEDCLAVEYDYETDDGTIEWTKLLFEEVISYEWRDNSCVEEDDVVNFDKIRSQDKSCFLVGKTSLWQERYGWQEFQKNKGGKKRFRHFTIYFDDAGCINIIASKCTIG